MTRSTTKNRQVLFDAALDLFAAAGYQRTSHADIAALAGIARTTFYEYFASTEELLVQLVEDRLPPMADEMIAEVPCTLPPVERLHALISKLLEFVGTDPLGVILHSEVPKLSEQAQRRISAAHEHLSNAFVETYEQGVDAGAFHDMPGALAARIIYGITMMAGADLITRLDPASHVDECTDLVNRLLFNGLRAA